MENHILQVPKNSPKVQILLKGYLAAAGAAIGGAVGYAFGGKGSSKENEVDDSLIEDAEKVDPAISKLPPHKVDKDQLKKETTLSHDATFDDKELVASDDRKIWEKETDDYNKNMVSPIKQIL